MLSSRVFKRGAFGVRGKISAALLIAALASSAVAAPRSVTPQAAPARAFIGSGAVVPRALKFEVLPLERSHQNHLLLRASINGKPALLAVDTGAPVSAISTRRVAFFGMTPAPANSEIPTRLQINGSFNGVAIARTLRLGALNLLEEPMVAIDLGSSSRAAQVMKEQAIDGIIGADILFPTAAVLDCAGQRLILKIDPDVRGSAPGLSFRGWSRVPIHVSSGFNLYVDGTLNGKPAKLLVDTGAFATLLHQPFVRRMKISTRKSPFSSAGVNLKARGVQFATISRFSIGSVNMQRKEVGVVDLEGLIRDGLLDATPPVAGLLGSEILRRHNAIVDFGTRTLYLKK